jgi:hypothetical protein
MKKSLKVFIVSLVLTFISCEKTDLTQAETTTTLSKAPTPPPSVGYTDVKSLYINNGITSNGNCTRNILVFPSWDRYNQVMDYLDQQTEIYCDAFDALQPTPQTDDQYDAACLAANFDEDKKLLQFENSFTFCSLRKKLNIQEDAWLDLQGDGDWDLTSDPDNHFIDDYTERSMLNEGVEVIIGPTDAKKTGYILYKFTGEGEYYTIALTTTSATNNTIVNTGAITALQQINNGTYVAGSNPNVIFYNKESIQANCGDEVVYSDDYTNGSNISRFIAKSVMKNSLGTNCPTNGNPCTNIFPSKIKAITRGFHKKNGKWRKRRTWIVAEICGSTMGSDANPLIDCVNPKTEYKIKNKKRRRVKVKVKNTNYIPPVGAPLRSDFTVTETNNVYSRHSQGDFVIMHNYKNLAN